MEQLVPEDKGEQWYQKIQGLFTYFMATLGYELEAFPEDGLRSFDDCYLSCVTLVSLEGMTAMRSLMHRTALVG